jgi:Ran GTPase-activating protein (RanGAP) involved in mRNA processing and transport
MGSRCDEVHRFAGSNAKEIVASLRRSADASERVLELIICNKSIHDETLYELEQFLFDYHRVVDLTNLELPHNELTPLSGRPLAAILSLQHETLRSLSLAHNPFTSVGLNQILEPLLSHSPQQATNLIHLDLTDTQLGSKGGRVIAQLLRNNDTLQELNLTNNSIGPNGIKAIVPELTANSSLQLLNLSYNNIKPRGATLLANALEESTSVCNLKSLELTGNNLGHKGMQILSKMLTVDRTIESFYAGTNNIGPEGAAHLSFAIKRNYTLRKLHINDNNIGPEAASLLFDQLRDDNRTLENLNVANNSIGTEGASDLAAVFRQNEALTHIDLSGNRIESNGVISLMDALSYNISLVHLQLSNNRIDDRGARAISEVLSDPKSSPTLQTISWDGNPDISEEGLIPLSRAAQIKRNREHWLDRFVQNLIGGKVHSINWTKRKIGNEEVLLLNKALNDPNIQDKPPLIRSLWLGGSLLTSQSLVPLFRSCISSPSNVLRLYIKNCCNNTTNNNTCDDSTEAIAEALPYSKCLEVLSLTGCGITPRGAIHIARGLRQNTTLRRLNLDDNRIGDDGIGELASILPHAKLTSLSANGNSITDSSMGSEGLSQVDELHLKNNQITDRGALDLARNLMDGGCRLTYVSLQDNRVTRKGGETIRTFMTEVIPGTAIVDY